MPNKEVVLLDINFIFEEIHEFPTSSTGSNHEEYSGMYKRHDKT